MLWFPPAPAAGPASLLTLPPDGWALEPKIDGIRILWVEGRPFTRQGSLLSPSKGAARLTQTLSGIQHTLDGEWVGAWDEFVVFDLPDSPFDYDGRRLALTQLLKPCAPERDVSQLEGATVQSVTTSIPRVRLVASYGAGFPQVYAGLKRQGAEGVVLKRRKSPYAKQSRAGVESRDWLKRRFAWD